MHRTLTLAVVLISLAALVAQAARAEDPPEDLADLLRQAIAAETADRDIDRAVGLYERVVRAGGDGSVARDAALRVLPLYEARRATEKARDTAVFLWARCGSALDAESQAKVREALLRLLPPGSSVEGPLGVVARPPAPGPADAAPIENKIRALALEKSQNARALLKQIGTDALPALEKIVRVENPEVSSFAARVLVEIGGVASFPPLLRVAREGDPFARGAATEALVQVYWPPNEDAEARKAYLAALTDLETVAPENKHESIRERRGALLSAEEVYALAAEGGPCADEWLARAVTRLHPPALERVIERTAQGKPLPAGLVAALARAAGWSTAAAEARGLVVTLYNPALSSAQRLTALRALAAQPPSPQVTDAVKRVAAACFWGSPAADPDGAAGTAWDYAVRIPQAEDRRRALLEMTEAGLPMPPRFLAEQRAAYTDFLRNGLRQDPKDWQRDAILGGARMAAEGFWPAIADALGPDASALARSRLTRLVWVALVRAARDPQTPLPPKEHDALWLPVLDDLLQDPASMPSREVWPYAAAARSGDPRFLAWVRRALPRCSPGDPERLLNLVREYYRGPGLVEFAEDSLTEPVAFLPTLVARVLEERAFFERFLARAKSLDPTTRAGALARLERAISGWSASPPSRDRWPAQPYLPLLAASAADERWIDLLADEWPKPRQLSSQRITEVAAKWAAASGSPRFLDLARACVRSTDRDAQFFAAQLLDALPYYAGEIPLAWAEALVTDPAYPTPGTENDVSLLPLRRVVADASPEGRAALRRIAANPQAKVCPWAISYLADGAGGAAELLPLLAPEAKPEARPKDQRVRLVEAAQALRLKAAVPFLLTQYQGDLETEAAGALNVIRTYHEQLALYERWATDMEAGRRDLGALLEDPDPAIRRAAVLSLGAIGEKDALPALVRIAKEEKDPSVRAAALEAVERIASGSGSGK